MKYPFRIDQPLILLLGVDGSPRHASVVYGYDASNFYFYDVNSRDTQQSLSYGASGFGTYGGYNSFGFVALPSLGRTQDFEALTVEAEGGGTTSADITLAGVRDSIKASSGVVNGGRRTSMQKRGSR